MTFNVTITAVLSPDLVTRSPLPSPVASDGKYVYPPEVLVGGTIGVRVICENATCLQESSQKQSVLQTGDSVTWTWLITAGSPGSASISIVATTYDQGSETVLSEKRIVESFTVTTTGSYVWSRIAGWLQWLIGVVGVGAIGTGVTWIRRRLRKHRSVHSEGEAASPQHPPAPVSTPEESTESSRPEGPEQ